MNELDYLQKLGDVLTLQIIKNYLLSFPEELMEEKLAQDMIAKFVDHVNDEIKDLLDGGSIEIEIIVKE